MTNLFLLRKRAPSWADNVQVKVGFSLLLMVFLAIPTFLLLLQNPWLLLIYMIYPMAASTGLYLFYRGQKYFGSLVLVLSVYGVLFWIASMIGLAKISPLVWWTIALLPWVMFTSEQRLGLAITTVMPVILSLIIPFFPSTPSRLMPAEQDFLQQILRISVGLGAFSCIFFLRTYFFETEKLRILESEFYSNTLNNIPLPIIIKDGITLDYIFFNNAAQLTYDLKPGAQNSNTSTFSESCAIAVSRLDHEALRSATYHIEPDENLMHLTGLHWHFRTYRIPLELKSIKRRLLITISEDLRALNLVARKAQENSDALQTIFRFLSPVLVKYDTATARIEILSASATPKIADELLENIKSYLEHFIPRQKEPGGGINRVHRFTLEKSSFDFHFDLSASEREVIGLVIEAIPHSDEKSL